MQRGVAAGVGAGLEQGQPAHPARLAATGLVLRRAAPLAGLWGAEAQAAELFERGRAVVVGIPPTNRHSFSAGETRRKGLTVAWSRRMKAIHMLRAIEMADHGLVSLDDMITATYPLAEAARAFDDLVARNGLKIVVKPTE